jgi:hypothetical protein
MMYEMDFDDFQEAFIKEIITYDQFVSVLLDNFGHVKTKQILKKNLKLALKNERRRIYEANRPPEAS